MSIEIAKKLLEEIGNDETRMKELRKNPEEFIKAGKYDCTLDELKEVAMLDRELDEDELAAANGGFASGKGSCWSNYYKEDCQSTVEPGSWCWSGDWCDSFSETYTHQPRLIQR